MVWATVGVEYRQAHFKHISCAGRMIVRITVTLHALAAGPARTEVSCKPIHKGEVSLPVVQQKAIRHIGVS